MYTNFKQFITSVSFTQWFVLTMVLLALSDVMPGVAATVAGFTFLVVLVTKFG
jgi:hypothetical protein